MKLLTGASDKLLEGSAEELVFLNKSAWCNEASAQAERNRLPCFVSFQVPTPAQASGWLLSTPNLGNHGTDSD